MKNKTFSIIVAHDKNNGIGKNGDLPWRLSTDMQWFKFITTANSDSTVIMGRTTWESIPEKFRPLSNRRNIVVTRNAEYVADGADVVTSLDDAFGTAYEGSDNVFVIGGGSIYEQCVYRNDLKRIYATIVHADMKCDTFFPMVNGYGYDCDIVNVEENGISYSIKSYTKFI